MKILRIISTVVILTKFDEIPLTKIATPTYTQLLVDRYNFANVEIKQIPNLRLTATFQLGLFQTESDEIVIASLEIEERKIIVNVEGDEHSTNVFLADLLELLSRFGNATEDDFLTPVIEANESEITVELGFNIKAIISPDYLHFVSKSIQPEVGLGNSTTQVRPTSVRFEVEYLPDDFVLQNQRIALSRKELILQVKPGHPLKENIFVSKLPAKSDTHIKLLEELEALYSESLSNLTQ